MIFHSLNSIKDRLLIFEFFHNLRTKLADFSPYKLKIHFSSHFYNFNFFIFLESVFLEKRQHSVLSSDVDDNKSDDLNFSISSKTARKIDSTISDQSSIGQQSQKSQQEVQLKRLHDMIVVQQDQICQASRALAFCRQNDQFRGGREEVFFIFFGVFVEFIFYIARNMSFSHSKIIFIQI